KDINLWKLFWSNFTKSGKGRRNHKLNMVEPNINLNLDEPESKIFNRAANRIQHIIPNIQFLEFLFLLAVSILFEIIAISSSFSLEMFFNLWIGFIISFFLMSFRHTRVSFNSFNPIFIL